jgi:MOSC domain-containing protein YiiM
MLNNNMVTIKKLYSKTQSGKAMQEQNELVLFKNQGIQGDIHARVSSPRQVLITTIDDHKTLGLETNQLRSNIVLDGITISEIESGDELCIGDTHIRITYLCEPCRHLFSVAGFETDDWRTLTTRR